MQRTTPQRETFLLWCFTKRTDAFTCKFESHKCHSTIEIAPCLIEYSNKIDIFIGKIAHTVRMFCHGDMLLLPHARRITQHRDGTLRGNSACPFHFVFWIGSCIFSFRVTSALGLELGTRLWFVNWITGEIAPLSCWHKAWCLCKGDQQLCHPLSTLSFTKQHDNKINIYFTCICHFIGGKQCKCIGANTQIDVFHAMFRIHPITCVTSKCARFCLFRFYANSIQKMGLLLLLQLPICILCCFVELP